MFAHLVTFSLGPGTRSMAVGLADQFAPVMRGVKGFKSATFMLNEATGDCAATTVWESKEDLEVAIAATVPQLQKAIAGMGKAPAVLRVFEVYEPKA